MQYIKKDIVSFGIILVILFFKFQIKDLRSNFLTDDVYCLFEEECQAEFILSNQAQEQLQTFADSSPFGRNYYSEGSLNYKALFLSTIQFVHTNSRTLKFKREGETNVLCFSHNQAETNIKYQLSDGTLVILGITDLNDIAQLQACLVSKHSIN